MGVRGLKTFMEREKQIRTVNIGNEVTKWKSENANQIPIIVIDFLSLANCVSRKYEDVICGGRHQIALNSWREILNAFKATEAKLVFFSDLVIQANKIEEWMNRRDDEFNIYTNLYDQIDAHKTLHEIAAEEVNRKGLSSTFYGMAVIAHGYGEFNYSIRHECDLEVAQYAMQHNAIAIITNDTDFLIFDGRWRYWSSQEITITRLNHLETIEYNRDGIANICSLARHQLPLFATLVSNDFTHVYYDDLSRFASNFGPLKFRIKNIARFVRKEGHANLSTRDITRITQKVFGYTNTEIVDVFEESLASYNVNFAPVAITDPLEKKLLHTNMYRPYMANMSSIHGLTMGFYDMRGCEPGNCLPILLIDWLKRRKGILRKNHKDNYSFILLAKKSININYMDTEEIPIYPEFEIPSLETLFSNATDDLDSRWKIIGWVLSFSENVISAMKQLPKDFLIICAALYALVKNKLLSIAEADGILYTESKVYSNETSHVGHPTVLVSKFVRAAHIYNIVFSHIRQNFAISGLVSFVQETLQFDGVYFQMLMEKQMNAGEWEILLTPIKKYRIYAEIK